MDITNAISLLGGVALFLFGMSVMGNALKNVAGNSLEITLYRLSSTPIKGILLGTGVTAVIQSSSATSVMVVGFVNSGMMKVKQAIGIIMGAILGTSVTGWILCLNSLGGSGASIAKYFSTAMITGVFAVIGIVLYTMSKKQTTKYVGEILLGFAVLMYGMTAMSSAVAPLRESETFINILTTFTNPIIGILAGVLITSVLQSASATVGILQALAVTGAVTFEVAFPLLMGIGIGASVPVLLSALGASVNGKRTAFIYLIIDILGAVICGTIFYAVNAVVHFGFMTSIMNMFTIAGLNTLYRLITVILLTPTIGLLERLICRIFPDDPEVLKEQADMDRLEERFLEHPALALEQSHMVIDSMAEKTYQNIMDAIEVRQNYSPSGIKKVNDLETVIDRYEDKLGSYLMTLTKKRLTDSQNNAVGLYLHTLSDFERISDHAKNIGESAQEIVDKKAQFTEVAEKELHVLESAVKEIVHISFHAFTEEDAEAAKRIQALEEVIDELCHELKSNHIQRLKDNLCTLENGFIWNDLLTNYERISDHCNNIGGSVLEAKMGVFEAHKYEINVKERLDSDFRTYLEEYQNNYKIQA